MLVSSIQQSIQLHTHTHIYSFPYFSIVGYYNIEYSSLCYTLGPFCLSILCISSFQSLICVWLFGTPWTIARQVSQSITNSQSLLKLMAIKSVMSYNHLILCHPLLLLPSIFPSIKVFSKESVLFIRWPKYRSFSFSISPSNKYSGRFPLGWTGLISLQWSILFYI